MVRTLDQFSPGMCGEILSIQADDHCCCLRRLGLREGLRVEILSDHDPVLIRFEGCCVALRKMMLKGIIASEQKKCAGGRRGVEVAINPQCCRADCEHKDLTGQGLESAEGVGLTREGQRIGRGRRRGWGLRRLFREMS